MQTIVNRGAARADLGRIVRSMDSSFPFHAKITGSATAPVSETTGFAFLPGSRGQLRITAKGIAAGGVKLSLRSYSLLSSEDITLSAGDSVVLSTRPHDRILRSIATDKPIGAMGTIELEYLLSNAIQQAGDKQDRLFGVMREAVGVDEDATAYRSGDDGVLVAFA